MINFMMRIEVIATTLQQLVATSVGIYEGAYSTRKVAAERTPAKLPKPTRNPVLAAREFSSVSLLLCQLWTRHEGI